MKRFALLLTLVLALTASALYSQVPGKIANRYGQTYGDNAYLRFGNAEDSVVGYNTTQTPDSTFWGLSTDSNALILGEKADSAYNFAHSLQTNPTLFIQSHNQSATEWISISHNGTNGVIDVGTGGVSFPDGIVGTPVAAGDSAITTTNTNAAGGSANPFDITSALGIMDGSDDYTAIDVNLTNANHTGASNTVQGLDISGITGDAQATETAINIGNGWDVGLNAGNGGITTSGTITSSIATSIGWSVVAGANTACNTTCTNACVFGQNTADMSIVDCSAATADVCVCAGAN